MKSTDLQSAIADLASAGKRPKDLMSEIKARFPKATKKEIIRAAFAEMIATADRDLELSRGLQNFAITERGD